MTTRLTPPSSSRSWTGLNWPWIFLARRANVADLADFKLRMKWLKYLLGRGFTQEQGRYALSALQGAICNHSVSALLQAIAAC